MSLASNKVESSIVTDNYMTSLTNTNSELQKSSRPSQKQAHILAYQNEQTGYYHTANFAASTMQTKTIESKENSNIQNGITMMQNETEREGFIQQASIE